jgi:Ca-activated chloride channel family protein
VKGLAEFAVACALAPLLLGFGVLEKRDAEIEAGNAAMKAGKAEDALTHYDQAVKKLSADAGAHFDRGAALYALSRFDEAGQEFLRATEAKDPALKASAFYNLGNAFFKKEKFKEAVSAYTRTLGLKPDDKQAKWNLEIALKKQKEEEKKQQDKKDQDDQKKNKDDKKDDKQDKDKKDDQKKDNKQDNKQDKDKQDKKDQGQKDKQDQQKEDQQQPKPEPGKQDDQQQIQSVLDNLERSQKDLEKERARVRAVRRAPPERDW